MRQRLAQWNAFLDIHWTDLLVTDEQWIAAAAEPDLDDEVVADEAGEKLPRHPDLTRRRLYRVFNNTSFDQGGRFYGGWWQSVPSRWRPYITINDLSERLVCT